MKLTREKLYAPDVDEDEKVTFIHLLCVHLHHVDWLVGWWWLLLLLLLLLLFVAGVCFHCSFDSISDVQKALEAVRAVQPRAQAGGAGAVAGHAPMDVAAKLEQRRKRDAAKREGKCARARERESVCMCVYVCVCVFVCVCVRMSNSLAVCFCVSGISRFMCTYILAESGLVFSTVSEFVRAVKSEVQSDDNNVNLNNDNSSLHGAAGAGAVKVEPVAQTGPRPVIMNEVSDSAETTKFSFDEFLFLLMLTPYVRERMARSSRRS